MFLITSGAYVTPALASEFGKLPPCMLPVQNKRLYEHQISIVPPGESIVISLPQSYELTIYDKRNIEKLGITVVKTPDSLTLGQSIVYVLNVLGRYDEKLKILHGDTLFSKIIGNDDICAVAKAQDSYDLAKADKKNRNVYAGYFSFSDQSLLIQKITENNYNFIEGIESYRLFKPLTNILFPDWMDFGLSNSYYRSISKLTTQRFFNSLNITKYSLRKSSADKNKMAAESNWIESLPIPMRHYAPVVWDKGETEEFGYYEIEYFFLPSLANLFVFGKNNLEIWEEIIDACVEYLNDEVNYRPYEPQNQANQNDKLYSVKSLKRLEEYSVQSGISLDKSWKINGIEIPSLSQILVELENHISKKDIRFATLMHGDPCFSNILYDFKSKSIKVIDPRGIDLDGNLSIYGDFRYDVGKLSHSVLGLYDFIISGMYEYHETSKYDISLVFHTSEEIIQIQNYFKSKKFGGFSIEEISVYPIMIHLFLSMLPLHNDFPDRQKAMLANALRLYVEFKSLRRL